MSLTLTQKPTAPTLTYAQYLAEGAVEGRYDIVNGVRVWMSNPTVRHQDVLFNLAAALKAFSRNTNQGRMVVAACDVLISTAPLKTRQPDILFISHGRFGSRDLQDPSALSPAPELVIEVLSPSDTRRVLADKLRDYRIAGVRECWVVSLDLSTVEVLRLSPEAEQIVAVYELEDSVQSEAFPVLRVPAAAIFAF